MNLLHLWLAFLNPIIHSNVYTLLLLARPSHLRVVKGLNGVAGAFVAGAGAAVDDVARQAFPTDLSGPERRAGTSIASNVRVLLHSVA